MQVTTAARINYEILGNKAPALHAHVLPRYAEEPADLREKPIWFFDWENAPAYSEERDAELREQIAAAIERLRGA
jgi:diadenosine tetraphosphate (Ap4A) HIT family hydrolase